MTDNVINLKNNALQFKYFSNKNKPENDWIPFGDIAAGIFYKATLVKYPYLAQDDYLLKLDNKEQIDINPFNFLIQESQGQRAFINQLPHDFVLSEDLLEFPSGTPILEIRTKNSRGQWQKWQAVIGSFKLYSTLALGSKHYLRSPIENELEHFKKHFEIRYSGLLYVSYFKDISVMGDDGIIKTFSTNTREIEFLPDSDNPCWSFEDRVKTWNDFIAKYHSYDSNGNRI
ncbi:hypothetical protein [Enterococcus faecalis]|uniref:hypothetical protein n=1 Tax=Enterococcus faecalis TaxID=1351 RepID=UPI0010281E4E|nr:hypothetical protein [Enterococcus faecalis]EHU9655891.1 hypothetical protein [Enterococcus faecalis]VFA80725.1 Uncharacterised protein [Enterococcus faecalis]HEC4826585.1 hypothetical protein [Enterococcus faecalis]